MEHIKDIRKGDIYFSGSDIGWVVGHSFTVYGIYSNYNFLMNFIYLIKNYKGPLL